VVATPRAWLAAGAAALIVGGAVACHLVAFAPPDPHVDDCNPLRENGGAGLPTALVAFDAVDADFFAAPFPALGRVDDAQGGLQGAVDGDRFPADTPLLFRLRRLTSTDGYGVSAAIFFQLDGAVPAGVLPASFAAPAFPDASSDAASAAAPGVFVFPRGHPDQPATVNVDVSWTRYAVGDGSQSRQGFLLSILPVQGLPLAANTDYVAVVTTAIAQPSTFMQTLCGRATPAGISDADAQQYLDAVQQDLAGPLGVGCAQIAAMSLFHTSDPAHELPQVQALAHDDLTVNELGCDAQPLPREGDSSGWRCEQAAYCVYSGTVLVPDYQRGTPPYLPYVSWQGSWPQEPVGSPSGGAPGCTPDLGSAPEPSDPTSWAPTWRAARVVVTIPHAPPPTRDDGTRASAYPVVVMARTGAGPGGSWVDSIVDRGPTLGGDCKTQVCRGPAEVFTSVGYAGISIDGPLVGISGTQPDEFNEDLAIFDFLNPDALRDNIRQSAVELTLVPDILQHLKIDLGQCEGAGTGDARFDLSHMALFSHSMGSTISPLALAADPRYGAAILSGSGGSLIQNVLYKTQPLPVSAGGLLFGYAVSACDLSPRDPQLSLLQWALEPADSESYARRMVSDLGPPGTWATPHARDVLMIQGLVDHYILPPIADVMSLGEGLDLGVGPGSCNDDRYCDKDPVHGEVAAQGYPALADLLGLSGHRVLALADAGGNVAWPPNVPPPTPPRNLTALVVQHRIDENREPGTCSVDGHEVIFESLLARHQYACFLHDFLNDETPRVRTSGDLFTPCTL